MSQFEHRPACHRIQYSRISILNALVILQRIFAGGLRNETAEHLITNDIQDTSSCFGVQAMEHVSGSNPDTANSNRTENSGSLSFTQDLDRVRCLVIDLIINEQLIKKHTSVKNTYSSTNNQDIEYLRNYQALMESYLKRDHLINQMAELLFSLFKKESSMLAENVNNIAETSKEVKFKSLMDLCLSSVNSLRYMLITKLLMLVIRDSATHTELIERVIKRTLASVEKYKLTQKSETFFDDLSNMHDEYFLSLIFDLDNVFAMRPYNQWKEYIQSGKWFPRYGKGERFIVFRHIFIGCIITKMKNTNKNRAFKQVELEYMDMYKKNSGKTSIIIFSNPNEKVKAIDNMINNLNQLRNSTVAALIEIETTMLKPHLVLFELADLTDELTNKKLANNAPCAIYKKKSINNLSCAIQFSDIKHVNFACREALACMLKRCKDGFEDTVKFITEYIDFEYSWEVPIESVTSEFYQKMITNDNFSSEQKYYLQNAFNCLLMDFIFCNEITLNPYTEIAGLDIQKRSLDTYMIAHYSKTIARMLQFSYKHFQALLV